MFLSFIAMTSVCQLKCYAVLHCLDVRSSYDECIRLTQSQAAFWYLTLRLWANSVM
jgi:hypothetical protein